MDDPEDDGVGRASDRLEESEGADSDPDVNEAKSAAEPREAARSSEENTSAKGQQDRATPPGVVGKANNAREGIYEMPSDVADVDVTVSSRATEGDQSASSGAGDTKEPMCPNLVFSILWFLAIFVIGIPVSLLLAVAYVLALPMGACFAALPVKLDSLMYLLKFPLLFARNVVTMAACEKATWDIKHVV